MTTLQKNNYKSLFFTIFILIVLNIVGFYFFKRFDLTQDKRYTLSETSLKIIKEVENDTTLTPHSDELEGITLISGMTIKSGKIVSEKFNKEIGSTTFVLSNGIVVHYKFTDIEKNNVLFEADSFGGNSLLKDADLPSASYLSTFARMSGLGDYNAKK